MVRLAATRALSSMARAFRCRIPTSMPTPIRYTDLLGPYGNLVEDLTGGKIGRDRPCHLDPDIVTGSVARLPGWRGALGQVAAAQGHLKRQAIADGDLFLFWGIFRHAVRRDGRWKFEGRPEHRIFGWLQIGKIVHLGSDGSHAVETHPWIKDHPHARSGWTESNTLYIASETLHIEGRHLSLPGWGHLHSGYRMTAEQSDSKYRPSLWNAPRWLNPLHGGVGMTYHDTAERWSESTLQVAARGQEFVARVGGREDACRWLSDVLAHGEQL